MISEDMALQKDTQKMDLKKKHASIRNDIFHQNQKQRSRDTAISFSHMTLLNHVISGGYFPVNDDW